MTPTVPVAILPKVVALFLALLKTSSNFIQGFAKRVGDAAPSCCPSEITPIAYLPCMITKDGSINLSTSYPFRRFWREWYPPRFDSPTALLSSFHVLLNLHINLIALPLDLFLCATRLMCIANSLNHSMLQGLLLHLVGVSPGRSRDFSIESPCCRPYYPRRTRPY